MKATATANANIALVKYWGNRNDSLVLPNNSSVSMTTDNLNTVTTVEFSKKFFSDIFFLDGKKVFGPIAKRISNHIDLIRKIAGSRQKAKVYSKNNFPTAAGLASSASGFAALTLAAIKAFDLDFGQKELSMLARRGSGSASRSVFGGFVEWRRGHKKNGADSFAVQVAKPSHWKDFSMIAAVVSSKKKNVQSNVGMKQTVLTSPMYKSWLETIDYDVWAVKKGILEKDFSLVGSIAEQNAVKMHSTMFTTKPPIIYWQPVSLSVIHLVFELREDGTECYFTMDAGPQVKILCQKKSVKKIQKRLRSLKGVEKIILCKAGGGVAPSKKHLF